MQKLKTAIEKLTPKFFSTLAINYSSSEIFCFIQFAATVQIPNVLRIEGSREPARLPERGSPRLLTQKGYTCKTTPLQEFNILVEGLDTAALYLTIAQSISFPLESSLCT